MVFLIQHHTAVLPKTLCEWGIHEVALEHKEFHIHPKKKKANLSLLSLMRVAISQKRCYLYISA